MTASRSELGGELRIVLLLLTTSPNARRWFDMLYFKPVVVTL